MAEEDVTAETLAALARIHGRLYQDLEASFADEPEPYTAEDQAFDAWCDQHPLAQDDVA